MSQEKQRSYETMMPSLEVDRMVYIIVMRPLALFCLGLSVIYTAIRTHQLCTFCYRSVKTAYASVVAGHVPRVTIRLPTDSEAALTKTC